MTTGPVSIMKSAVVRRLFLLRKMEGNVRKPKKMSYAGLVINKEN